MHRNQINKPVERSRIRRRLGREFYILKRKIKWLIHRKDYARKPSVDLAEDVVTYLVKSHKTIILRPLKNVDMHLQYNKITNLRLAARHIDRIVIRPGEKLSVWKLVGRPTRRKGYLNGLVIYNGRIGEGVGGGLCQLGNLIYWMALHTDLDITERWRHSFDVFPDVNRTVPFACGATLGYNYIDLELQNNTPDTYSIHVWVDKKYLNGEICCSREADYKIKVYETDHAIRQQWWGGYTRHNRIWKRRYSASGSVKEVLVSENHAIMMYNPMLPE